MALENLTPEVREEEILNGSDIDPATRLEYFLKKAANEVPKPAGATDAGKTVEVNSSGEGYELVKTYKYLSGLFTDMAAATGVTGLNGNVRAVLAGDMLYIFFSATATEYPASSDAVLAPMFSLKPAENSSDNGKALRAMLDCARLHGVGAASNGVMRQVFNAVLFEDSSYIADATKAAKLSVAYYSDSTAYSFVFTNSLTNGGAFRDAVIAFFCPHDQIVWPPVLD